MVNNNKKSLAALAILVIILMWLCSDSSSYTPAPVDAAPPVPVPVDAPAPPPAPMNGVVGMDVVAPEQYAQADLANTDINLNLGCAMNSGVGLASSLLPREVASQENFGEFAPNDVLKGQNLLDPRQQIGIPETIGGSLRNSNQSIRADPPNPKQAYEWNNSTIVPDLMQRSLC